MVKPGTVRILAQITSLLSPCRSSFASRPSAGVQEDGKKVFKAGGKKLWKSLRLLTSSHTSLSNLFQQGGIISPRGLNPKCFEHELFAFLTTQLFKQSQLLASDTSSQRQHRAELAALMTLPSGISQLGTSVKSLYPEMILPDQFSIEMGLTRLSSLFLIFRRNLGLCVPEDYGVNGCRAHGTI